MRVLVIGASGLIGSAVTVRLIHEDCDVIAVARRTGRLARSVPAAHWIALDIAAVRRPEAWLPYLDGVGAVVNCAGVLQDSPRDSTRGVHVEGISALFAACAQIGIRRVVHFSAIGVDHETPTAFSRTKLEGDRALMRLDLDWVILRPSVVVGAAAYGGSALFRGLAALPILPVMPETGRLQVVQLEDVVQTVVLAVSSQIPPRVALDLAGPEPLSLMEILRQYRRWLGCAEPRMLPLPRPAAILLYRLGDFAGWLGWRPPIRSTAEREIARGATGDPSAWIRVTGITPRSLADALAARPASVQERWFSGLYVLKPVAFAVLSLFWVVTGIIALGPGYSAGADLMQAAGAGALSGGFVVAGAVADIFVGTGIAVRRTTHFALWSALALSLLYIVAGTVMIPRLWIEPLGSMVKIWPILVLQLIALAILEDR